MGLLALRNGERELPFCGTIPMGRLAPPRIKKLIADLERAGFVNRGGKGSHRNFVHPNVPRPITISGALGDDAKQYQVRAVERALKESTS